MEVYGTVDGETRLDLVSSDKDDLESNEIDDLERNNIDDSISSNSGGVNSGSNEQASSSSNNLISSSNKDVISSNNGNLTRCSDVKLISSSGGDVSGSGKRLLQVAGGGDRGGKRDWIWETDLHGDPLELRPIENHGRTHQHLRWNFHDGFCGIGTATMGFRAAGGVCTGGFDNDSRAKAVFQQHCDAPLFGGLGTFEAAKLDDADVYVAGPPGDVFKRKGFQGSYRLKQQKLMTDQLQLIAHHKYKVICIEQSPSFRTADNGIHYRKFAHQLAAKGYKIFTKLMFAPTHAASVARRSLMIVGVRTDVHAVTGDFQFPSPTTTTMHPLRSVLEPEFFRRNVGVRGKHFTKFSKPKQVNSYSLKQVGYLGREEEGHRVYSPEGFAATQRVKSRGLGGTTGLYLIRGRVTQLTLKEAMALHQIDEGVTLDSVPSIARKQLGQSMPVGVMHAMGSAIGLLLGKYREGSTDDNENVSNSRSPPLDGAEPTQVEQHRAQVAELKHMMQVAAWQAAARARQLQREAAVRKECPRMCELSTNERLVVEAGVQQLHWRRWLCLQMSQGLAACDRLRKEVYDEQYITEAKQEVMRVLSAERSRGCGESGPVNLLWWNWPLASQKRLREKLRLPLDRPPVYVFPDNYETSHQQKAYDEFARMMELGYMSGPHQKGEGVLMSHPAACVPKKHTDKLRLLVDLTASGLNSCFTPPRFVLPSVGDVVEKAYPGCYMLKSDLTDGFYMVDLDEESAKLMGVLHPETGEYIRYERLCMGSNVSPAIFSRLVAEAVQELKNYPEFRPVRFVVNNTNPSMPRVYGVRSDGLPVATLDYFVDDGLIVAPTPEACTEAFRRLTWYFEAKLGMRICTRKTEGPAQRMEFLGLMLDSVGKDTGGPCTQVPDERKRRCSRIVDDFLTRHRTKGKVARRDLASLIGELSFASHAIPAGSTFLKRMYECLHEEASGATGDPRDFDRRVQVTTEALLDARWWQQCLRRSKCARLWRTRSFALHRAWTDASDYGLAESIAVEGEGELPAMAFSHGVWPEAVAGMSSNYHELATIVRSVGQRLQQLQHSTVYYMTDNTTAVSAINKGTVRSPELMRLVRELRWLQAEGDIAVEAYHLPGRMIIRHGTDGASRCMPWQGNYGSNPLDHDFFTPMAWPRFDLPAEIQRKVQQYSGLGTVDMSDPADWANHLDTAGKDTFWHLEPRHATHAFRWMLESQLREPADTSFTVVVPMIGVRNWARFLKHFRQEKFAIHVEELGDVMHWLLRFEPGDGLRARAETPE